MKARFSCRVFFITISIFGLASCLAVAESKTDCGEQQHSSDCLLQNASKTLVNIEDSFDWSSGAIELAIAYDTSGNSDKAWQLAEQALQRSQTIEEAGKRETAWADIALAMAKLHPDQRSIKIINSIEAELAKVENSGKRADILGKILSAQSVHGDADDAYDHALAMPRKEENEDAFRGRTLREIAAQFAKQGEFEKSLLALNKIDARFTYYSAIARTDVAAIALSKNKSNSKYLEDLLKEAESIAETQENGYFAAGILRNISHVLFLQKKREPALGFLHRAKAASRLAKSPQEQSRSMSRIATRMADCGEIALASEIIDESLKLLEKEESTLMRDYSKYEAAGAAAFSKLFDVNEALLEAIPNTPFGSARSLKNSAQRDLAWGLARYGQWDQAIKVANNIDSNREKVHALSRLVRLLANPKMDALPRYL